MIGKTLGHYEIEGLLGKGGMGEVYRARDPRLDRAVAIKILPASLMGNAERVARFQREARTLASLNHQNIAGLHGVEEADGQRFLVMELAAGVDLSDRMRHGALSLEEALEISEQIADGLEEAHEKGIVHRDLKPANIKVADDGAVKILDFGLARAFAGEGVDEGELGESPTITEALTMKGTILGTAAYMSPEQAKGKTVDRRSDVWSFGVILWEMLTGKRLFEAETTSEVLAAVLRADLPWDDLPESTPSAVRRLLERCLERDPRVRLRDIGEARIRLRRWAADPTTMHESTTGSLPAIEDSRRIPTAVPWILLLAVAGLAAWGWLADRGPDEPATPPLELSIRLEGEEGFDLARSNNDNFRLSPDGTRLAYQGPDGLYLRHMASQAVQRVEGSEVTQNFVFSPDGEWIAFFASGTVYRASVTGGAPIPICEADDPRGMAWVDDDTLVLPRSYDEGLSVVSVATGDVTALTTLDRTRGERSHRWPSVVPGRRAVVMCCTFGGRPYDQSDIEIVDLDTKERSVVHRGGTAPRVTDAGHLVFVRGQALHAIAFDATTNATSGLAVEVLDGVATSVADQEIDNGRADYDIDRRGNLIYRTAAGLTSTSQLAYVDLATGEQTPLGTPGQHTSIAVSPDERWIAVSRSVPASATNELYLVDRERRGERRLTERTMITSAGAFSPDSRTLYWTQSSGDDTWWAVRQRIDGSTPIDTLARARGTLLVDSVSPDERWVLVSNWKLDQRWDLGRIETTADVQDVATWIGGPGSQIAAMLSPDGKWLAYAAPDNGQDVLLLRRFPDTGAVWSVNPGPTRYVNIVWAADGGALLLVGSSGVGRVTIESADGRVEIGRPETLFPANDLVRLNVSTTLGYFGVTPPFTPSRDGRGGFVFRTEGSAGIQPQELVYVTRWVDRVEGALRRGR